MGISFPGAKKTHGRAVRSYLWRNSIYPGFVYLLLGLFRDFRAIIIAQHLLGLVAGGMLLLTWHRLRVFVAHPRVSLSDFTTRSGWSRRRRSFWQANRCTLRCNFDRKACVHFCSASIFTFLHSSPPAGSSSTGAWRQRFMVLWVCLSPDCWVP